MSKAIFLGSFNPPHIGHLNCIKSVANSDIIKQLNIDAIHIIPCYQNPNKSKSTEYLDRYKMCTLEFAHLNIESNVDIFVDDIEGEIKSTYTYELIDYLHSGKDNFIDDDFWWIITEETYEELLRNNWKESVKLLDENKFIIIHYESQPGWLHRNYAKAVKEQRIVYIELNNENVNIHSTNIREMIKNNENVDSYINLGTCTYINEHNLYR